MKSLQGQLLIASPHLPDPNFLRTVVLMVEHDEEGALGLVLTRPTDMMVQTAWKQLTSEEISQTDPIFLGGPVQGPLMALHNYAPSNEIEVVPGLYFANQQENLDPLIRGDHAPYRLFIGYSGWSAQQLESEMEVGGWLTLPVDVDTLFSVDHEKIWKASMNRVGGDILRESLNLKNIPDDPSLN
ncbi:MAG: hypothetical protein COA78_03255 [Blastopirellula sp.]|nr:MAG: hypothetical protein COA78_03255 [Blastopirellula sp.]